MIIIKLKLLSYTNSRIKICFPLYFSGEFVKEEIKARKEKNAGSIRTGRGGVKQWRGFWEG